MSTVKLLVSALVAGILFSGCGTSYSTLVTPSKSEASVLKITVDQDAIPMTTYDIGRVTRLNYKYAFASAATATKRAGYKYFSISAPSSLIEQYKERKVVTLEDAYSACDTGEGSFFVAPILARDFSEKTKCEEATFKWSDPVIGSGTMKHSKIIIEVQMHNEDRADNITFNADDVLNSKLLSELNPKKF
ncbi:hypothetical protein [Sulfurimonas gotlandica]|nr:hypothetical protein [Sulfurimonas gotlandica]EDZ61962.1 hypothetical protein CBGD1_2541 [Sulfurimonas gotlandica GD1]